MESRNTLYWRYKTIQDTDIPKLELEFKDIAAGIPGKGVWYPKLAAWAKDKKSEPEAKEMARRLLKKALEIQVDWKTVIQLRETVGATYGNSTPKEKKAQEEHLYELEQCKKSLNSWQHYCGLLSNVMFPEAAKTWKL